MNANGWAGVLRNSNTKKQEHSVSFEPQNLIKDTPQKIDAMRASFGKQIFQMIKDYQKMLKSKKISDSMKGQLQEAYAFMVRAARLDVRNLMAFQSEVIRVYYSLYDGVAKQTLDVLIIRLEHLIVRQAQILRKIDCAIQMQTRECRTKEAYHEFCQSLEEMINQGDYKDALGLLLLFNYIFDLNTAESLINVTKKASASYPKDASDFLPLLEKRVHLHSFLPSLQSYSEFKNNPLLVSMEIKEESNKELDSFSVLLEDAVKYHGYLWEEKLKDHFKNDILKEIDSLIGLKKESS